MAGGRYATRGQIGKQSTTTTAMEERDTQKAPREKLIEEIKKQERRIRRLKAFTTDSFIELKVKIAKLEHFEMVLAELKIALATEELDDVLGVNEDAGISL